ncbi:MAG: polyprenyl synthetase family protein [Chloroflexota bacterium]
MNALQDCTAHMLPALEKEMRLVLKEEEKAKDPFYGMLHYHMGWVDQEFNPITGKAGKRIRPLLCLLSCEAAGGDWEQAIPASSAIELVHNFSLIHDDIEDKSPTRRGKATIWTIWGMEQAINIGDTMFALSHLAMARLADRGVAPQITVDALRRFDETCVALTYGQYHDMDFENRQVVSVDDYLGMITGKTAVLLSLCAELGARIAGKGEKAQHHYGQFGLKCGLAFQVIDDILGIWGDEAKIGKSASTDLLTKKKTLPVLFGLENDANLRTLYQSTNNPDEAFVEEATARLTEVGALDFAKEKASEYSHDALHHLESVEPSGDAGEAIYQLTEMLLKRDF